MTRLDPPVPAAGRRVLPAGLMTLGCGLVITGMFLPWLRSGSVDRNSFQIAGVLDRLGVVQDERWGWLPGAWPVVAVTALLPLVPAVLGLRRVAGACAVVLGVSALALGVGTLVLGAGRAAAGIRLVPTGPVVLAVGAAALLVGGLMSLRRRSPAGRTAHGQGGRPGRDDSGDGPVMPARPHR